MIKDFYKGNSVRLSIGITRNGVAMNITGMSIILCLKNSKDDPNEDSVILKEITAHTNPSVGLTEIFLSSAETNAIAEKRYFYEILMEISSTEILTVASGKVNCLKGVYDV